MRPDGDLSEGVVGLGDRAFLLDPAGRAMGGHQRDLAVAGRGANDLAQRAQLVFLLQRVHQRALVLVGDEITALAVGADLQRVLHGKMAAAVAHGGPEGRPVLVGAAARPLVGASLRAGGQRGSGGRVHLALQLGGALLSLDGVAEIDHFLLHALILRRVLGGEHAVLVLMLGQEGFRPVPDLSALFAHLMDVVHTAFLLVIVWSV